MNHDIVIITNKHSIKRLSLAERAQIDFRQMLASMTRDEQVALAKSMRSPKRCGGLDYKNRNI